MVKTRRKRYRGSRLAGVFVNGRPLRHVALHSPTGFDWGYGGSGPADLALSILADYCGENARDVRLGRSHAYRWHQAFKWAFIAGLGEEWEIDGEAIGAWLARKREECTWIG